MYRCCRKIVREDCNFAAKHEEESHIIDCENGAISVHRAWNRKQKDFSKKQKGHLETSKLMCMSDFTHEFSHPPVDFNLKKFLKKSIVIHIHI
jgi:hypothetical protein